jgi:hypothetical protein
MIAGNNFLSTLDRRSLYEQDYAQWLEVMAAFIRDRKYEQLDWENLLEELESMGKNEQRELESRLIVLLMHLLKFQYQPSHRTKSWQNTIRNQRTEIGLLLKKSPSLRAKLLFFVEEAYPTARFDAADETDLPLEIFPDRVLYSLEEILDKSWFPQ